MEQPVTGLVVADDERLAQSLEALLLAVPGMGSVTVSGDRAGVAEHAAVERPHVAVMTLGAGLAAAATALKAASPTTICVALGCDQAEQQAALAAGAELAFVRGYPAPQLYQAILTLLDPHHSSETGRQK